MANLALALLRRASLDLVLRLPATMYLTHTSVRGLGRSPRGTEAER